MVRIVFTEVSIAWLYFAYSQGALKSAGNYCGEKGNAFYVRRASK